MHTTDNRACKPQRFMQRIAMWAAVAAFAGTSLIANNLVQAARAVTPVGTASHGAGMVPGAISAGVGLIDHSSLGNANLLPEPNAALLHSDPNDYMQVVAIER
jgi:hypothetical protein